MLTFGSATDYALLLVSRYREELRQQDLPRDAMRTALGSAAPAILASAGTVVCGLLCLLLARVGGTQAVGPLSAAGVALSAVSSLTVLPVLLVLAGRRAFWPFVPRVGDRDHSARNPWQRLGSWVANRPRPVWVVGLLALSLLAAGRRSST